MEKGEVPEWSIGTVSKTVVAARSPWVRIPPSPPSFLDRHRPISRIGWIDRRGDRVVEGARLEIVCSVYSATVGSNPTLSAIWRLTKMTRHFSKSLGRFLESEKLLSRKLLSYTQMWNGCFKAREFLRGKGRQIEDIRLSLGMIRKRQAFWHVVGAAFVRQVFEWGSSSVWESASLARMRSSVRARLSPYVIDPL